MEADRGWRSIHYSSPLEDPLRCQPGREGTGRARVCGVRGGVGREGRLRRRAERLCGEGISIAS